MGAPTVSGEEIERQTAEEYGLPAQTDEEAERALLARFLFEPPERQTVAGERNGLVLDRVSKQLEALLRMLSGRPIKLAYSDPAATDNVNVYLPRAVPAPEEPTDALLYRCMGLVQTGFVVHGLLRERAVLAELHRDWVLRSAWHLLAARWVLRKWSERYPGLADDVRRVALLDKAGQMRVNVTAVPRDGMPAAFLPLYDGLATCLNWRTPGSEADPAREAVRAVDRYTGDTPGPLLVGQAQRLREHFRRLRLGPPPLPWFVGIVRPEWILADLARDVAYEQEWKKGNKPLRLLMEAMARNGGKPPPPPLPEAAKPGLRARLFAKIAGPSMDKAPAYGALRDEFVAKQEARPAEPALFDDATKPDDDGTTRDHDEWDDKAGAYRLAAVKVVEQEAPPGPVEGYTRIVEANRRQIAQIRRRFEALRVEERWLHGEPDGPELDLNRVVAAVVDVHAGQQPDERIYARFVREKQTVAILTLVDQSGSTQGHVLHLEQEALVLCAEGLRALGHPHAFFGFGNTRPDVCELWRIKGFDEPWGEAVHKRLGNLRAAGATRLGAYLRHAGWLLSQRPQARRILMVVSDGHPEDRGDYRGQHGLRDAAMAVQEIRRVGVHPFCVSLDPAEDADTYLGPIFGKGKYLKLDNPDQLPNRLPEVFRNLVK